MANKHKTSRLFWGIAVLLSVMVSSCEYFNDPDQIKPIARLGDNFIYREDIPAYVYSGRSSADSAAAVNDFVNKWASKQIMISKARLNLPASQIQEFERLIANYRSDLYTLAYKEALVNQNTDTLVDSKTLLDFYETEKENFKLREKIVRLRFITVSDDYSDIDQLRNSLISYSEEDQQTLDSLSIYFKKINLNDSIWVPMSMVLKEISPLNSNNEHLYLKKSQFFEIQDSIGVYLGFVKDVLGANEAAPISYIEQNIRTVLLNRRKQAFLRSLESDIIDEAIKNNEFEIYE
ncbi:MAG: peptidyl-prolyl cis-trans isomerase [Flavobacteriaceae bacterium]|nr:peptidyl-prolyl cis-trans isomerase [Flavobacteriaceae bacterium]NVJ71992.1 peptidyl-prolyl cis-trans isomerase [Flavobacteriaceae bacterium]